MKSLFLPRRNRSDRTAFWASIAESAGLACRSANIIGSPETRTIGADRLTRYERAAVMFTGLVSDVGEVERVDAGAKLHHLRIACSYPAETIVPGASIACGGPCLTVVACGESGNRNWFEVDVGGGNACTHDRAALEARHATQSRTAAEDSATNLAAIS